MAIQIIPAILTQDRFEARAELERIQKAGNYSRVQVDFIDGEYANNFTIRPDELDMTPFLGLQFDAHLMVVEKNLTGYLKQARKVGYDRIIPQMESISNPGEFRGLALDVHSPVVVIEPYLHQLEVVVVMAIEPGFGGQKFDSGVMEKVKQLSSLREQSKFRFKICVDGGVQKEQLAELEKAGVDEVAVGAKRVLEWERNLV